MIRVTVGSVTGTVTVTVPGAGRDTGTLTV